MTNNVTSYSTSIADIRIAHHVKVYMGERKGYIFAASAKISRGNRAVEVYHHAGMNCWVYSDEPIEGCGSHAPERERRQIIRCTSLRQAMHLFGVMVGLRLNVSHGISDDKYECYDYWDVFQSDVAISPFNPIFNGLMARLPTHLFNRYADNVDLMAGAPA